MAGVSVAAILTVLHGEGIEFFLEKGADGRTVDPPVVWWVKDQLDYLARGASAIPMASAGWASTRVTARLEGDKVLWEGDRSWVPAITRDWIKANIPAVRAYLRMKPEMKALLSPAKVAEIAAFLAANPTWKPGHGPATVVKGQPLEAPVKAPPVAAPPAAPAPPAANVGTPAQVPTSAPAVAPPTTPPTTPQGHAVAPTGSKTSGEPIPVSYPTERATPLKVIVLSPEEEKEALEGARLLGECWRCSSQVFSVSPEYDPCPRHCMSCGLFLSGPTKKGE